MVLWGPPTPAGAVFTPEHREVLIAAPVVEEEHGERESKSSKTGVFTQDREIRTEAAAKRQATPEAVQAHHPK